MALVQAKLTGYVSCAEVLRCHEAKCLCVFLIIIESYGSNSHIGFVPYHEIIKKTRPAYNSRTEKRIV